MTIARAKAIDVLGVWVLLCAGTATAGELRRDQTVDSPALGRPLAYTVYLPDGHDAPDAALPVVFMLHGYGGNRNDWADAGGLAEALDRMIAAGTIAPVIAVMPDAGNSWYVDSARFGGPGDYESAIVEDLVPAIDRRYPTRGTADARAVAGLSMGGHGALRLAFRHPDTFGAVAALSPAIIRPGGFSWGDGPLGQTPEARERWYPRTTGETFDIDTFKAQSPFAAIDRLAADDDPPRILLASGDDDFFGFEDGTVDLYAALREADLEPALRIGEGGHDWPYWRSMVPVVFRFLDAGFR